MVKSYSRDYHRKNKEKYNKLAREKALKLKLEVLTHYGGGTPKCACCGESIIEFLTIDHINNNGEKHRKQIGSGGGFYRWLKENNFPKGYRVLCFNCNCGRKLTKNKICPHRSICI